jgi:PKD repeat protein
VLIEDVELSAGYTMTIPAGDVIKALAGANIGLKIYGTLNAIGTASDSIIFTSFYDDAHGGDLNGDGSATTPTKGDWTYILLAGSGTNQGIGNMDYCSVLYAGSSSAAVSFISPDEGYFTNSLVQYCDNHGVYAQTAVLNLNNSTFNDNGGDGIYAIGTSELQINDCAFNNNDGYAARLYGINITTYSSNTGSSNGIDAFGIAGNIDQDITLSENACGFPYVLIGEVLLSADYTMTIPAGEVIKCLGNYAGLTIYGTLNAIGTASASDSIIFTSLYDDTNGGDLNGDGSATTPAKGDWVYIRMNGSGTDQGIGNMDYCSVLYGGSSTAAVFFNRSDEGYFTNSLVQYSDTKGLYIYYSAITLRKNTFQDNDSYGVYILGTPVPDLGQNIFNKVGLNTFINNDGGNYQLYNASSLDINAWYNDWGYYTASEIDAHIYDDNENAGYGEVFFNPWHDPSNPRFDVIFGGDTLSGKAPFPVHFYDSTFFGATSWQWDFNNDGIIDDTTQNPWWIFYEEGLYPVKLVASNGPQKDSITFSDYIDVDGIQISHALQFDGTDDYVKTNSVPFPTEDHTLEAWIHPNALGSTMEIIYFFDPVDDVQFRVNPSGSLFYAESVGSNWNGVLSSSTIASNIWTHIAVTKQDDNINIYINGVLDNSGNLDKNPAPDTLYIGAQTPFNRRFFNGMIDEVRIWDIARSMSSIQKDMYRTLQGDESGLVSYWQFNEGFSPVTGDSVSGTIGTLHNMNNTDWKLSTAPTPFITIDEGNWETTDTWATGQDSPVHPWSRAIIKHSIILNSNMELIEMVIDTNAVMTTMPGDTLTVGGD